MENVIYNISLQELSEIEVLSARTKNICKYCNLKDIHSILDYYWENFDFLKLRNCGAKSNLELIGICHKYEKIVYQPKNEIFPEKLIIPENTVNPIIEKIDSLSIRQKKIVNNLIETHLNELSVRSSNALRAYFGSDIGIIGIKLILSNQESEIKYMRNVGERSIIEINGYVALIIELIELISLFENETEITVELFHAYLMRKFSLSQTILNEIDKNYDFTYGIPIFRTIKVLVDKEIIYTQRVKVIFYLGLAYFNDSTVCSLDKLAEISKLSRERSRQVREEIYENLNETFSFLKGMEFDAINLYGIDVSSNLIIVSEEQISEINHKEDNAFNLLFINKILSILLENSYSLIGDEENIVLEKIKAKRSSHNWNSTYLIKSELTNIFNFEEFISDINRRLNERIEEDYSFHFETYLTNFQKNDSTELSLIVIQISEHLLFSEFELCVDVDENIVFKRNTIKQVGEYVYEILYEKKIPLTVYEIYKLISQKYPNITKSAEALRGSCQRDPNLIYFGRSSTYGLKKWEDADIVKGGTMHDISEEYLDQFDVPKHIDEISKYVSNYRQDVTSNNLLYNLKSAENRRFVFFKNSHIGLVSKSYGVEFIKIDKTKIESKTWDENFLILEKFVLQNKRLPCSSGNDIEQKLYRFFNIQLRNANKELIDEIKTQKINSLVDLCNYRRRARGYTKNTHCTYDEMKLFVSQNNRLPKANNVEEKKLYYFFYRQATLFKNGKLLNEKMDKYLEIRNLIQLIHEN